MSLNSMSRTEIDSRFTGLDNLINERFDRMGEKLDDMSVVQTDQGQRLQAAERDITKVKTYATGVSAVSALMLPTVWSVIKGWLKIP